MYETALIIPHGSFDCWKSWISIKIFLKMIYDLLNVFVCFLSIWKKLNNVEHDVDMKT